MFSSLRALFALTAGGALLATTLGACAGADGSDDAASSSEAVHSKGKGGSKGTGGSAGAGGTDPAAIIAAAQTPDGQAIPQPPGANGQCAPVVALLGFWACVRQGDVCTYKTGTVTHHCSCIRVDGEGQGPAWNCD